MEGINFVGNVEGSTLTKDVCDVLVTDGFTGNILIKTVEGVGKLLLSQLKGVLTSGVASKIAALLVRKKVYAMKKKFDPNETGGAPILGISKPVIKAHGSSRAVAFKNAIHQAILYAESTTIQDITDAMQAQTQARQQQATATEQKSE